MRIVYLSLFVNVHLVTIVLVLCSQILDDLYKNTCSVTYVISTRGKKNVEKNSIIIQFFHTFCLFSTSQKVVMIIFFTIW